MSRLRRLLCRLRGHDLRYQRDVFAALSCRRCPWKG